MKMKVLLINPPSENTIEAEVPSVVNEERGHNPFLGLMYIASALLKKTDSQVKIIDCAVEGLNHDGLRNEIKRFDPDIIGMTAMSFTLLDNLKAAEIAKQVNNDIKVIFGGPHPHIFPEETINLENVDLIVLGEGEETIVELVNNIDSEDRWKEIKGIVFKDEGKAINTGLRPLTEDLDSIPFPARTLTPYKKYSSLLARRTPITTMETSRGCPYKCIFCDRPHLGKVFRARSPKDVAAEFEECVNLGIREILIYDDTFTINRKRVVDICNMIIERKLDVGWDIRARVNTVDKELLELMKKAGCQRIHYGVEAGNQKIMDVLKKGITREQVMKAFDATRKTGMDILAYFMIGSPRETRETIMDSINFAKKIRPDYVHFSITTPFPATELYQMGLNEGILKADVWKEFAKNPTKDFKPPLWEENLKREELIEMLYMAYKKFYTRPSYIVNKMLKIRSFAEFKRKAKAGLKIFGL